MGNRYKIERALEELKERVLELRSCAETFEEEVAVNSIKYAIEQAEQVFDRRKEL